jgi:hypothetical protein
MRWRASNRLTRQPCPQQPPGQRAAARPAPAMPTCKEVMVSTPHAQSKSRRTSRNSGFFLQSRGPRRR